MTEAEWASPQNGYVLVSGLTRQQVGRPSNRKFFLAACAACRFILARYPTDTREQRVVDLIEQFAEGAVTGVVIEHARNQLRSNWTPSERGRAALGSLAWAVSEAGFSYFGGGIRSTLAYAVDELGKQDQTLPALVRCIFGNPFRPATFSPEWRTSDAVALAKGIYDDRAFDRMPMLADALQDAGCASDDMLNHCRGDSPHARGCWVVDLVLGKA